MPARGCGGGARSAVQRAGARPLRRTASLSGKPMKRSAARSPAAQRARRPRPRGGPSRCRWPGCRPRPRAVEAGAGAARAEVLHAYAGVGQFAPQRLGEAVQAGLAGAVDAEAGQADAAPAPSRRTPPARAAGAADAAAAPASAASAPAGWCAAPVHLRWRSRLQAPKPARRRHARARCSSRRGRFASSAPRRRVRSARASTRASPAGSAVPARAPAAAAPATGRRA